MVVLVVIGAAVAAVVAVVGHKCELQMWGDQAGQARPVPYTVRSPTPIRVGYGPGLPRLEGKYMAKLRIKWVKSAIGYPKDQKATIRALGLRKLQQTVEHEDNPAMRGMIRKVNHLVKVEEVVS